MTLEWQGPGRRRRSSISTAIPTVVGGPYEYGVPGAVHGIFKPPTEARPVTAGARRRYRRPAGDPRMRTILVIANETIGGKALLDAVRRYAAEEESRFVLCVPQTRPRAGYVVYDDSAFDAAQTRVTWPWASSAPRASRRSARLAIPIPTRRRWTR